MLVMARCPNPECHETGRFEEPQHGQPVCCARCGQRFTLETPTEGPRPHGEFDPRQMSTLGEGATATPEAHPNPVQVGRFMIHQRLGTGAFGTVFRAYDPQLDRDLAVKVPHAGTLETPGAIERFLREGRSAAKLRHAHIVPVYDAGHDGTHYYIASAYIAGTTLLEELNAGPLEPRRCATLARDLAEALEHAHEHGIVHRDVKPSNILIDAKRNALLADFGLAQQRGPGGSSLTYVGTVMGTPGYMAPEMAAGIYGEMPPASDQYSLGVVLYEMLCGRRPFLGPSHVVLYHKVESDPPPPRLHHPSIPPELERICMRAMARQPENRYPSCAALAEALHRWLDGSINSSLSTAKVAPDPRPLEVANQPEPNDPPLFKVRRRWRWTPKPRRVKAPGQGRSPLWTVALSMSIWMLIVVAILLLAHFLQ
ncbi:hypothetical protein BH23PLA1_BH23PLA1_39650 [soil metagenome]